MGNDVVDEQERIPRAIDQWLRAATTEATRGRIPVCSQWMAAAIERPAVVWTASSERMTSSVAVAVHEAPTRPQSTCASSPLLLLARRATALNTGCKKHIFCGRSTLKLLDTLPLLVPRRRSGVQWFLALRQHVELPFVPISSVDEARLKVSTA
ncbi:hypothetical protein M422DRAFT_253255 [Sphaerobolus stellatus SS14]|uniref:Uncharacterized protein n=1 Tax=Sphaerobolus stellatus (strain SS14) TaxID=990650 RepID=A0A0C9UK32_SPHS4|nr:hypothetical protein M422DRAFT_253255 [Sphaerobolus stellatus SS14]